MADDPAKAESLQQFLAITGTTDVQAATHMLEGNAWDVGAAVNFFFSTGETGVGHGTSAGSTNANATQLRNSPVEVMEDDDHELQMALAASNTSNRAMPMMEDRFPQLRAQELAQKRAHEAQFVPDGFADSRATGIPENLRRFMDTDDDFGAPKYNPPSPSTMEARRVREEQDRAYEESLEMDRAKEMSKKEAQLAAQEAEKIAKQEAMRLAEEKEIRKNELNKEVSRKQALIPAEPKAGEEGVTTIGVRLQDGSRLPNRKFRSTDKIEVLYNWVETTLLQRQLEAGDVSPTKLFDLVSMAPVRAFKDRNMTLAEAELASQTLLSVQFRAS
ncbi:hypothetical protein GUITHDRAFT_120518 [Guillardia theta CCMP2712]|uniref:UBX domain-containing protein n=1 Tax=Guillardia theta (strain CCMP2712) TaxID=905079 RepID=L1IBN1_GUITC|nr:hypothetical protein GUITHDRAFT_120518 [Guillardia theta CCMP2712]EKX33304.1 hypothetical protein GUITHDRAFT_120518 [Guillardia theta CCMP2712]|eukprot:XP_005820284.1 hypothetical protein GUITHDRAFT_120518 [Guillardia theta CCMP2712]